MHLILNNYAEEIEESNLITKRMNEKIRVNYVNETYRKCLANKINSSNAHLLANIPRVKLVNKLLAKKKHLIARMIQSRRNIENSNDSEETDSNYQFNNNSKKRKQEDDLEMPTSKRIDAKSIETEISQTDIEMNEKYLWLIANNYSNLAEWKSVSLELGLDKSDLQIIQARYLISDGLKECFYQCLLKWRLKEPEHCYLGYFLNILRFKLDKSNEEIFKLKEAILAESSRQVSHKSTTMLKFYLSNLEQKKQTKLNESRLKMKLDETHLWSASGYLFQEWKAISRCLNLNELDLVSIEAKHLQSDGIRECCYQSLLKWSQCFYEQSCLEFLCLSLIKIEFNLYAKQLVEEFCF